MQGNTGWIPIHYKLYTGEYRVDTDLLLIIYRGIQGGYRSIINYYTREYRVDTDPLLIIIQRNRDPFLIRSIWF